MALIEIPLRSNLVSFSFRIDLDEQTFEFEVSWNGRAETWSCIIRDFDGNNLISFPLVTGVSLIERFTVKGLPEGQLILVDTNDLGQNPSSDNLGSRFKLTYLEATA